MSGSLFKRDDSYIWGGGSQFSPDLLLSRSSFGVSHYNWTIIWLKSTFLVFIAIIYQRSLHFVICHLDVRLIIHTDQIKNSFKSIKRKSFISKNRNLPLEFMKFGFFSILSNLNLLTVSVFWMLVSTNMTIRVSSINQALRSILHIISKNSMHLYTPDENIIDYLNLKF